MTDPQKLIYCKARVVFRGGIREDLRLVQVREGWRVACVPLGSEAIAFGDWVTLSEDSNPPLIVYVRQGEWRTILARTPIPPNDRILHEIASRGWLTQWNKDGLLSLAVRREDLAEGRRFLEAAEVAARYQHSGR